MKKTINILTKLIILLVFFYTYIVVENNGGNLSKTLIYFYLILVGFSLLSDRYFYRGQKSENKKEPELTGLFLSLTWFVSLIVPVLEYANFLRHNIILTSIGTILVVSGITVRGLGIKTLGEFFSRDVETWDNQRVVKSGIYKYIRHPAYAGNILQVIGFPLVLNSYFSLILSLITICGFLWRIKVEEKFLVKELQEYKDYMRETKRIIPGLW